MNLKKLLKILSDKTCRKVYVKNLAPNDNSKQQVYFGGNFEVLNILPSSESVSDNSGKRKSETIKRKLNFSWIDESGSIHPALHSQLILYPEYPEVRFSGFLLGCNQAPSEIMTSRLENRLLFLGITAEGKILGYATNPNSEISNEFNSLKELSFYGVFKEIIIDNGNVELNSRERLLSELKRIHLLGWIDAKRFDSNKNILSCVSSQCGGYTLEAELGITPNGYSEPDYLGWEIKQFGVTNFKKFDKKVITLMTPEPSSGYYVEKGIEAFIRKYGYDDKRGRESRINFGGIYKCNIPAKSTNLKLVLEGFDLKAKTFTANGYIALLDPNDNIASSWPFSSLLEHWTTKHQKACYVPSLNRKDEFLYPFSRQQYYYGSNVILGTSTEFSLFLTEVAKGNIYYDPGIKLELEIAGGRKQNIKRRSQFRIKSGNLASLYKKNEVIDISL